MKRNTKIGFTVAASILSVVGVLYTFGGMQPPSAEMRAAWDAEVRSGRQNAIGTKFVIPIPGCVCHSDDPGLQVQHSGVWISECRRCHG